MLWFQFDFLYQIHPLRHCWEIRLHKSFDSISIFISVLESSYKKPLKDQTPQKNFRAKSRSVSESDSKSLHDLTKSPKSDSGTRKADRRARYWKFLFDNLQRAVDAIYDTCETDESVVECKVLAYRNLLCVVCMLLLINKQFFPKNTVLITSTDEVLTIFVSSHQVFLEGLGKSTHYLSLTYKICPQWGDLQNWKIQVPNSRLLN